MGHVCRGRPCDDRQVGQGLERVVQVIGNAVDGSGDGGIKGTGIRPAEERHDCPGNRIAEICEMAPPDAPRADQEDRSDHQRPPRILPETQCYQRRSIPGTSERCDDARTDGRSRFVMLAAS
jgi:hypothetical protein